MIKRYTLFTRTGAFKFATLKDAKYSARSYIRGCRWFRVMDTVDGSIISQGEDLIS